MDYNQRHKNCINQFKDEFGNTAIKVSGGASYAKVADRQRIFREHFPDAQVLTDLKSIDDTHVVFKTLIKENPKLKTPELEAAINEAALLSLQLELDFIDKVYELGDLEGCSKYNLTNFIKNRVR